MQTMSVKVPQGMRPGEQVTVVSGNQQLTVVIPDGVEPGMEFQFQAPEPVTERALSKLGDLCTSSSLIFELRRSHVMSASGLVDQANAGLPALLLLTLIAAIPDPVE